MRTTISLLAFAPLLMAPFGLGCSRELEAAKAVGKADDVVELRTQENKETPQQVLERQRRERDRKAVAQFSETFRGVLTSHRNTEGERGPKQVAEDLRRLYNSLRAIDTHKCPKDLRDQFYKLLVPLREKVAIIDTVPSNLLEIVSFLEKTYESSEHDYLGTKSGARYRAQIAEIDANMTKEWNELQAIVLRYTEG